MSHPRHISPHTHFISGPVFFGRIIRTNSRYPGFCSQQRRGIHTEGFKARLQMYSQQFCSFQCISLRTYATAWKQRQKNDPFVKKRHNMGVRSRAYFKLEEMLKRIGANQRIKYVVDLGCSPGSWVEMMVHEWEKKGVKGGVCIGIDLLDVVPFSGVKGLVNESSAQEDDFVQPDPNAVPLATYSNPKTKNTVHILRGDFTHQRIKSKMESLLPVDRGLDLVMSDMAPEVSGIRFADHETILDLAEQAYDFACAHLDQNGTFICKLFRGGSEEKFKDRLKTSFDQVSFFKPESSRSDSREIFIVATGFKPKHSVEKMQQKKTQDVDAETETLFDDYLR